MNIDKYINHWKNIILKESSDYVCDSSSDELFLEDQSTSFFDVIKLIKKITKPEDYKEMYSDERIKQRIEDNYEKLSQEEKRRIRELVNNSTNYLSGDLSDKEEDEYHEIYDIISKMTSNQEQQEQEQEIKQDIKYNVYMRENDIDAETKTFDDEISAKKFITSRLRGVKRDMTKEEVGVYDASKMKFAKGIIPNFIIDVDPKAIMFRYPKSSFAYNDDDIEIKQNEGNNKLYFKEKDNPDSKPEKMSYWIDKYIEQKGLDKNNTEKRILDTAKSKFRNAYNTGQLTGEKSGGWSKENFPILQRCDKDGNPVASNKNSDNKNKDDYDEMNSVFYEYVLYKQDLNSIQKNQTNKDDVISMDKSDDEAWYDDYDDLDDED